MKIYKQAVIRLTVVYLAILAVVALIFSWNWYRVANQEVERALNRQEVVLRERGGFGPGALSEVRRNQILTSQDEIRNRIIAFNILVLTAGGVGSYFLARRTLKPIEESYMAQVRFTADASHELRTPLTVLLMETEVALRNQKLSKAEALKTLDSHYEELQKLSRLMEQLLRISRSDIADSIELHSVSIADIAGLAIERYQNPAKHKQIKLINNIRPAKVTGDAGSLEEIFAILIDNAIKYSPKKTTVAISGRKIGDTYQIKVKDEGIGIRATDLPHIFDRFYRADQSRSKIEADGHGLGLAIAQQLAGLNKTQIIASSTPGHGSTFSLKLPLSPKG